MAVDHGLFFFICWCSSEKPSLYIVFVDLLLYVGRDNRYSDETPLAILFVVEWILIWHLLWMLRSKYLDF